MDFSHFDQDPFCRPEKYISIGHCLQIPQKGHSAILHLTDLIAEIQDGVFQRNCKVRISREGKQIYEGALASLKRFKDDVKEVKAGYECGLVFEKFNDIQIDDIVEAYIMEEVPR